MFAWLLSLDRKNPIFEIDLKSYELHELVSKINPVELEELEFVESMARPNKTLRYMKLIWNVWIVSYLIKKAHYLYTMLVEYNLLSMGSRLAIDRDAITGRRLYSYACLASNCSTLFDPLVNATRSRLIMDELPVFSICHPYLARISEPPEHVNKLGISIAALSACFFSVLFILRTEQARIRTRNPLLLFLVAPNISRRLNFLRTEKHAENLHRSFLQYQQMTWAKRFAYNRSGARSSNLGVYELQSSSRRSARSKASPRVNQTQPPKWDYLSWEKRRFVYDCFPLVRFEQWRRHVADTLFFLTSSIFVSMVTNPIIFLWVANVYLDRNRFAMVEFQLELDRMGCSIWHAETNEPIRLTSLQYGFNAFGVISFGTTMVAMPMLSILLSGALVLTSSWELRCLICELKYKIVMLLPVIKNMTDAMLRERARFESSHRQSYLDEHNRLEYTLHEAGGGQQVTNEFKYAKLREKFTKDVRAVSLMLLNRPFLGGQLPLETQAYIMRECFDERLTSAVGLPHWPTILAELLEKLYVEFRILDDLVAETHPDISLITGTSAAMCYSTFLVTLIICKFTESISPEQYYVMLANLFGAIAMTVNSAILRAKVSSQLFQLGLL
jgi:hypothetical protein